MLPVKDFVGLQSKFCQSELIKNMYIGSDHDIYVLENTDKEYDWFSLTESFHIKLCHYVGQSLEWKFLEEF